MTSKRALGAVFAALLGCGARSGLDAIRTSTADADVEDVSIRDQSVPEQDSTLADVPVEQDSDVQDAPSDDIGVSDVASDVDAGCAPTGSGGSDAGCNPFTAACTTSVPPNAPAGGPLFFLLESSGCACGSGGPLQQMRMCANSIEVTPAMTIEQKCTTLVAAINAMCGSGPGQANFQADGTSCSGGTFTVRDLACDGHMAAGTGLTLALSSTRSTRANGILVDEEQDLLTSGCPALGNGVAMLNGTPTGSAIQASTQSSVVFVVSTLDRGKVIEGVSTSPPMTAADVVARAVLDANLALTGLHSNVRCAQDSIVPTVAGCTVNPTGDAGGAAPLGVPVTFEVNDTGLTRTVIAGPAQDIRAAVQAIHAAHGLPEVLTFNFVGGVTCSPCNGGASGPICCH
jgi:hypothetical protein